MRTDDGVVDDPEVSLAELFVESPATIRHGLVDDRTAIEIGDVEVPGWRRRTRIGGRLGDVLEGIALDHGRRFSVGRVAGFRFRTLRGRLRLRSVFGDELDLSDDVLIQFLQLWGRDPVRLVRASPDCPDFISDEKMIPHVKR